MCDFSCDHSVVGGAEYFVDLCPVPAGGRVSYVDAMVVVGPFTLVWRSAFGVGTNPFDWTLFVMFCGQAFVKDALWLRA